MPTRAEAICCQTHDISEKMVDFEEVDCITQHPGVQQLMADAPLELAWSHYLHHHGMYQSFPVTVILQQYDDLKNSKINGTNASKEQTCLYSMKT